MSKRRSRRSQGAPAAKRPRSQWSRTKFGEMVEAAGLYLGEKEENELTVEPAKFQQKLTVAFKTLSNLNAAADEFCQGLSDYIDDPVRFRMSLLATKISDGANVVSRIGGLDSLIRLLLGVGPIQPKVATTLLEKLPEYIDDDGMEGVELGMGDYQQMPHLILNQLRWLDQLVDGKELCSNLLQIVEAAPVDIQREIITALPEILDDPQHNETAKELKTLLQNKSNLTAAVIDALSNLNMATNIAEEVLEVALDRARSADIADLPTVIKFIMQYISPRNAQDVISELREKLELDFSPLPMNPISSTPRETQMSAKKLSAETSDHFVVFDTIRSSISFQKPVADGWTKAIDAVSEPQDHTPLDVFVLFILYSLPARKKSTESIFSSKIKAGCFSEELMGKVFGVHAGALRSFFPNILSLCENLLCSGSPSVSSFATSLYQHLFITFDVFCQQEVIGALIAHIGNGIRSEVDHALDIILSLLEHNYRSMQRFAVFIKSVLDFVEQLTVPQIRKLYHALSTLSFQQVEETTSLQDEMHTIIRKQLARSEPNYRHMGVIGAVMVIRQLAESSSAFDMNRTVVSQHSTTGLSPARKKKADTMLENVLKSCESSAECMIIFCDEMSPVVKSLDHTFLEDLSEKITSLFQDMFLVEITDPLPDIPGIPLDFCHGLDNSEEGTIALNLLPMVVSSTERVRAMAAHFHLLCVLVMAQNGNLEDVDALLGCAIVMCKAEKLAKDVFEDLPLPRRQDVCLSLFHCLNWLRELVCAFAHEADPDMKGKVLIRLTNITDLQSQFEICMNATPGFWPPSVVAAPEETLQTKVKKGKGGKSDVTLASITAAATQLDKDSTSVDKAASSSNAPAIPIERLRPFFRELDLRVFGILNYGILSRTFLDSEELTREREELKLRPPQLAFLLQDLLSKLSSTFSLFGSKNKSKDGGETFTEKELVLTMTGLIPPFCKNLEDIGEFFQSQIAESDGIVDADSSHPDYATNVFCFHLLLKCLSIFFGWSSLSDRLYVDSLKQSLTSVVTRLSSSSSSQLGTTSLHLLAKKCCEYFQQFGDSLPTLTCAHSLAKVLVAVCKTSKAEQHQRSISECLGNFLKRPWRTSESNQIRNEALEYLLKYHFEWAGDPLDVIETMVGDAVTELMGEEGRQTSQKYPTLTESTLPCFYRSMMSSLVHELKAIPVPKKSKPLTDEQFEDRLHLLAISTKVLYLLMNLVKSFDRRPVLSAALKYGKAYMEAFLRSGMPVLDHLLRPKKDEVASVIKTLQSSTRCLQHYCAHSKASKDTNLVNHVPQLKRILETMLFKVKEILDHNQCSGAYWLGNLKNRDIQGHEILSQASQRSEEEEEEGEREEGSDEEMEEDDRSVTNSTSTDRKSRDEDIDSDSTTS